MSTTTTMTDDDTPTSAYATPMSSIISLYPAAPDALDENSVVDLFLASTSTAWSGSPLVQSQHLPSPIHHPTTPLPPNSLPTTPVAAVLRFPLPVPASTTTTSSSQAAPSSTTTLPSPRIRKPRYSTRMGSLSPSINSNSNTNAAAIPLHLIIRNNNTTIIPPSPPITPISRSTPIPIPPTPTDFKLTPIPPDEKEELPLFPEFVDQLLRGPVLQTVQLPDV